MRYLNHEQRTRGLDRDQAVRAVRWAMALPEPRSAREVSGKSGTRTVWPGPVMDYGLSIPLRSYGEDIDDYPTSLLARPRSREDWI